LGSFFFKEYIYQKRIIMKKVLLFLAVVAGLGFTSCSKSGCECTQDGNTFTLTEDEFKEAGGTGDFKDACKEDEECKLV